MLRWTTSLSREIGYHSGWQIAIHLDQLGGQGASRPRLPATLGPGYGQDEFRNIARVTMRQLRGDPTAIAADLLRPLFRDFGMENLLPATGHGR